MCQLYLKRKTCHLDCSAHQLTNTNELNEKFAEYNIHTDNVPFMIIINEDTRKRELMPALTLGQLS